MYDSNQPTSVTPSNVTPTPFPPQQNSNFVVQPEPKQSRKGLIATVIILSVLLVGALGTIAFLLFFQPKSSPTVVENTTAISEDDHAKKLIVKIKSALNEQLAGKYPDIQATSGTVSPAYKPASTAYAVASTQLGESLTINSNPATYDQAGQTEIQRVATQTLAGEADLKSTTTDWQTTYQNNDVICTVSRVTTPLSVSCANTKSYEALVTQVAPFAEAYLASEQGKQDGEGVILSAPTITQKSNGYRNATIAISNTETPVGMFTGLFYAKDSNWAYWGGTQSAVPCANYNTYDLQYSFEGDVCKDTTANTLSTVKITL